MMPFQSSAESMGRLRRTLWTYETTAGGGEILRRTALKEKATFVASLTDNGLHAPAIDLDRQVEVTELVPGLTRLVFPGLQPSETSWDSLLDFMEQAGLRAKPGSLPISRADPRYADGCSEEAAMEQRERWEAAVDLAMEGKTSWDVHFDLIVPVLALPSSTPGHFHLYLDVEMRWAEYRKLCKLMAEAGLVEHNWLVMADKWRMTTLLKPGLTKAQLAAENRPLPCMVRKPASAFDY